MKQFAFTIHEGFVRGLRAEARMRHQDFLHEAKNVRAKPWGLEPFIPVTDPFTGHSPAFPWPQMVHGVFDRLLFGQTSLERFGDAWSRTPLTTYNQANGAAVKAIVAGGQWHFADLGRAWFAFNGSCVVFNTGLERLHGLAEKVFVQDTVTIETGCAHKGRIFVGGFNPANVWANWSTILNAWDTAETDVMTPRDDIGGNFVMWSTIGGGDFPLWLFYPQSAGYTYDLDKDLLGIRERVLRNEWGWKDMPFRGKVLRVAPLGDYVIVYGEDGVVAMKPEQGVGSHDVPSTYREIPLLSVGIRHRSVVGIAAKQEQSGPMPTKHIFIDSAGDLWQINADLNYARLGYKEFLASINLATSRIFYNPQLDEFHICSVSGKNFILTESGLTEHTQRATSGALIGGVFRGPSNAVTDIEMLVVSKAFTTATPGIKTFTEVFIEGSFSDLQVALDFRYKKSDSWTRSGFKPLNKEGRARIQVSGIEARLVIKGATYVGQQIDRVVVAFQHHDKRYRRGTELDPSFTRSGERDVASS